MLNPLKRVLQSRVCGIVAALSVTFLTACGPEDKPVIPEFDVDKGLCYSMTPLLQTLPQSSNLGSFVELQRDCSFHTVSALYADKEAPGRPRYEITTKVIDGKSTFVNFFTKDRPDVLQDPAVTQRMISRYGKRSLMHFKDCHQHAVELGTAIPVRHFSVVTEEAGHQVCISTFFSHKRGEMYGDLYIQPRPDILMEVRYTRSSKEDWHDVDDVAQYLLPLVSKLNIPTSDWPKPIEISKNDGAGRQP